MNIIFFISNNAEIIAKGVGIIVLTIFLPLTAWTYYSFRRERGQLEVKRILDLLNVQDDYREIYGFDSDYGNRNFNNDGNGGKSNRFHRKNEYSKSEWRFLLVAVFYVSMVTFVGLILLFFSSNIGLDEFPAVELGKSTGDVVFPKDGSRLIFGMAFLGAYVWGLQYIFQRYSLNDLTPSVYYSLGVRMIFASLIALVMYNATDALALVGGEDPNSSNGLLTKIWPALAFVIGMFPRRGIRWFTERIPVLSAQANASVRRAPLDMVEGIGSYDSLRLEELGIDTCYDLATTDFVPLILKTPYSARQLVDWIQQAKLCACFGEGVRELRQHGIWTIAGLEHLTDRDIEQLAAETTLTKSALEQAREAVKYDAEIKRLNRIGMVLSKFAQINDEMLLPQKIQNERQRADHAEKQLADLREKLQQIGMDPDTL